MDVIGDEESDGYVDDDLDALISEDFLELQQRAIRSTQHQRQHSNEQGTHSLPSSASVPFRPRTQQAAGNKPVQTQAESFTENPSSDYGDLDDEVLDAGLIDSPKNKLGGNVFSNLVPGVAGVNAQQEQWRKQRFSVPPQLQGNAARPSIPQVRSGPNNAHHGRDYDESFEEEDELLDNGIVKPTEGAHSNEHGPELKALEAKVAEVRLMLAILCWDIVLIMPF